MEILAPQLQWIGGRCYRVNKTNEEVGRESVIDDAQPAMYIEEDLYGEEDSEELDNYDIQPTASSRFKTTFHIPKSFYGVVIGAKGTTRKRIEAETKTSIKVPNPGAEGDIEVTGATRQSVASARRRIELVVIGARAKQEPTHFLCVPFVHQNVRDRYARFKQEIVSGPSHFGLDESMFQNPNKLHLTFGMLALMDSTDLKLSTQLLHDAQQSIVRPILQRSGALDLRMLGVEYMNDDPSQIDVLYGKVECEPLQAIADGMVELFVRHGLMPKQHDRVKLHVTLINSLFRNNSGDYFDGGEHAAGRPEASRAPRRAFDGRQILAKYAAFDFGKQPLNEIHIARRYTTNCVGGFYDASAVAKML